MHGAIEQLDDMIETFEYQVPVESA
jgi:hypothetical protein